MKKNILAILAVVVSVVALGFSLISFSKKIPSTIGAVGTLLVEDYVPVIRFNEGYYSAYGITLTGSDGDITTGDDLTVTDDATITGELTVSGITSVDKFYEGSGVNSTTTPANITLAASDIQNYSVIEMNPTVGDITVTLTASSSLTTFIPTAGQIGRFAFQNSTTTNGVDITLAAGTGTYLQTASSTLNINYNNRFGILTCIRKANTDIYCSLEN